MAPGGAEGTITPGLITVPGRGETTGPGACIGGREGVNPGLKPPLNPGRGAGLGGTYPPIQGDTGWGNGTYPSVGE